MKLLLVVVIALAIAVSGAADTYVTEDITTDTTWDLAGSPYILYDVIEVLSGSTLTIDPGVAVKLDSIASLRTTTGSPIVAVGSPGNEILFTSAADEPAPYDWWAIYAHGPSASVFTHCVFEYGRYNMYCDGCDATISDCVSRYSYITGFNCEDASPTITGCETVYNREGIGVSGGSPVITDCEITENETGLVVEGPISHPVIHNCNVYDNSTANMRVSGYEVRPPIVVLDAESNWWGVDTALEIEATIDIATASMGFVEVDYDPWLHEVPVEESSWGRVKALYR